jgi:hypothetical protein
MNTRFSGVLEFEKMGKIGTVHEVLEPRSTERQCPFGGLYLSSQKPACWRNLSS